MILFTETYRHFVKIKGASKKRIQKIFYRGFNSIENKTINTYACSKINQTKTGQNIGTIVKL